VRADFHLHTRADQQFTHKVEDGGFVETYVDAMADADIRVGAITNHNKFDRDEFKALRKCARKKGIHLLPGLELSVKDGKHGIHTLVLFHDDWIVNQESTNYIQSFLDVTFAGQANFENEDGRSNHDLNDTIRTLNKYQKDYFILFAHVEEENGLWGGLSGGRITELGKSEQFRSRCLGFQKVRTRDLRDKVKDWLDDWYPAEIEGCDCKRIVDIGRGQHQTHLKIGDFNFEAIKYALLDHKNRLGASPSGRTNSYVRSIAFEGDKMDGQTVHLSPEMNALIGIRGSGKSSILESLRYALGIEFGENATDREYKEGSVSHALGSGGKITVTAVDRHGREYEVRRIVNEYPDVYFEGKLQPGINTRETVVYKPMYFGQKDLSNTGVGFETDLVEKLVGEKLADVRGRIEAQKQKIQETTRRLGKLFDVGEKEKEQEGKKQDAEFRLRIFKEHGVEEKLQKQTDYEEDAKKAEAITDHSSSFTEALEEFLGDYKDGFEDLRKYKSKQNEPFFTGLFERFDKIKAVFDTLVADIEELKQHADDVSTKAGEFDAIKQAMKEEFAEIARKLTEELKESGAIAIKPGDFLTLTGVIEDTEKVLAGLKKDKEKQSTLEMQLSEELTQLNTYWHNEFTLIKQQLDRINEQETALQIEVEYKGDKRAFLQHMKDVFRGSKLREATLKAVTEGFQDSPAIYRDLEKAKKTVGKSAQTFEEYFGDNLNDLLSWQVPNRYRIKYHQKELKSHSLGQRASALILFVLSQRDNDVIIIDQPEDDLDNQTIYEDVIKLLRTLKRNTQFIFATHNANVPVLGDAEQIVACDFSGDEISTKVGSVDCPELQEAIVSIMEGGSEAFERRKEIYQLWRHKEA